MGWDRAGRSRGPGGRRIEVYGPAYLDRVIRVDRRLLDPGIGGTVDLSADGAWEAGAGLRLADPAGGVIEVEAPADWPGPTGTVRLSRPIAPGAGPWHRAVTGLAWLDDLGGMGAGYAKAFGAELTCALGPEDDPASATVADLLARAGVACRPVRVPGRSADWTLLITSGPFGDKLPVGFRGCLAGLDGFPADRRPCDLRVAASLTNRLAASALDAPGAAVRFFAPALRNMLDRDPPLIRFADGIDVLACNRREWEALADRDAVDALIPIVSVTDGPEGSSVRFCRPDGSRGEVRVPAFPRHHPPADTNRAGEAYASTLVTFLMDSGWLPDTAHEDLILSAAVRASAAAALELDLTDFGFPTPADVDAALAAGVVGGPG